MMARKQYRDSSTIPTKRRRGQISKPKEKTYSTVCLNKEGCMVGLFAQIEAFLLTFLLGMIAGLIFHYYQSTIHNLRMSRYVLYLMDFILWIIMIIVIAAALFLINLGEIRVYVFIALVAGGAVYYKCLARYMQRPILFLGGATAFM